MKSGPLRVFHPTELTRDGELAFAHAVRIAEAGSSTLAVMHVGHLDEELRWDDFPSAASLLRRWGMLAPDDEGMKVTRVEARGENVVGAILEYLDDHPFDLLVLATRGRQGFDAWFSGSVAEPVARLSRTMTLFVKHGCDGFVTPDRGQVSLDHVLVPVCASPRPDEALEIARALPKLLGVEDARITTCFVGDGAQAPLVGEVPMVIRQGDVADTIVDLATELDVDLVAMATEGRLGVLDALRGSTTEQVVRRSPCPVLAVPAAQAANPT